MPLTVVFAAILATLTACGREPVAEPGVTRADSAGVRIVTSTGADTTLAWRFEELDVMRDSLGEPYLFTRLWRGAVITDRAGRTYVLTRDPSVVRFGRDGRAERTFGRRGEGPGEMQLPASLDAMGDTVFVHDLVKQSLVRWSPTLDPIGDRRLDGALSGANRVAFRAGGLWLQRTTVGDSGRIITFVTDTTAAPPHTIAIPSGGTARLGCMTLYQTMPLFAPTISWATNGARALVSAGASYELHLYEGPRLIAIVRRAVASRAPTIEDVRALYPEGFKIAAGGSAACVVPIETVIEQMGLAERYPAVHDLTLLADGTIWIQRDPTTSASPIVDVFASTGAYAGTVRGMRLPIGRLPNGELLVPRLDEDTGGYLLARVRVTP